MSIVPFLIWTFGYRAFATGPPFLPCVYDSFNLFFIPLLKCGKYEFLLVSDTTQNSQQSQNPETAEKKHSSKQRGLEEEPRLTRTPERVSPCPGDIPLEKEILPSDVPRKRNASVEPFNQTLEEIFPDDPPKKHRSDKGQNQRRKKQTLPSTRENAKTKQETHLAKRRSRSQKKTSRIATPCRHNISGSHRSNSLRSRKARSRSRKRRRASRSDSRATGSSTHAYRPGQEEQALINGMISELTEAIRDRAEFSKFDIHSIANSARILIRFGIESFAELRSTRADQRGHFIADAKKSYRFKSLKLIHELFSLFPPVKRGRNIASIEYNEVHLPKRLKGFTANLSSLAGTLRPTQEMVNVVSEAIARGEANPQPFFPYVTADYQQHPWLPRINAHTNALTAWKSKAQGVRKKAISFQMWMHHHYRFVFAAEMCNAWSPFGGLAAQLNHIAVLLSLASLESAGYAIKYHDLLVTTLADFARARFPCDFHSALSEVHEDTRRALARETATPQGRPNAPAASNEGYRPPKGKGKAKGKGSKGKGKSQKGKKGGKRSGANAQALGKGATNPNTAPVISGTLPTDKLTLKKPS